MERILLFLLLLLHLSIGVPFAQQEGGHAEELSTDPMNLTVWPLALAVLVLAAGFYWKRKLSVEQSRTADAITELNLVKAELEQKKLELQQLSNIDFLTGLYHRAKLEETLQSEFERADRYNLMFGVVLIDIDHFKQVNETHGYDMGDRVLQEFAELLACNTRLTDTVGRWGGEEFIIVCPETDEMGLQQLAEKLRKRIEKYEFPSIGQKTASFGLSLLRNGDDNRGLVGRAEAALCRAKESGRNRVEIYTG